MWRVVYGVQSARPTSVMRKPVASQIASGGLARYVAGLEAAATGNPWTTKQLEQLEHPAGTAGAADWLPPPPWSLVQ
jgi:hypothetical protein